MNAEQILVDLKKLGSAKKAASSSRFFKTGKGQYGEGDRFLGVTVPEQRRIAKKYPNIPASELSALIALPFHEARLTALLIAVAQFTHADKLGRKKIVDWYLKNRHLVNNWDLVDSSAHQILGEWLVDMDRSILLRYSKSRLLWERRIAIVSTYAFIRRGDFVLTLEIAKNLLKDKEDLVHKATGWMLRDVGKRSEHALKEFLNAHATAMPRTALRYAIERLSPKDRSYYLSLGKDMNR